jgi:hypothetical protein
MRDLQRLPPFPAPSCQKRVGPATSRGKIVTYCDEWPPKSPYTRLIRPASEGEVFGRPRRPARIRLAPSGGRALGPRLRARGPSRSVASSERLPGGDSLIENLGGLGDRLSFGREGHFGAIVNLRRFEERPAKPARTGSVRLYSYCELVIFCHISIMRQMRRLFHIEIRLAW